MLRNIYKLALRNLLRRRSYGITNILGLAIGISSALLIIMYCIDELSFDAMHPMAENTYRIGGDFSSVNGFNGQFAGGPAGWDNYLKDNYPSVTHNTGFQIMGMPTSIKYEPLDKIILTENIIWAESNINELMFMEVVKGSEENILPQLNSIVLTESAADRIFGERDPINEILSVSHMFATDSVEVSVVVTGIIKDLPANSHLQPEFIINHEVVRRFVDNPEEFDNWSPNLNLFSQSLFVCTNPEDIDLIRDDLQKLMDEAITSNNFDFSYRTIIKNVRDLHFDQELDWSFGAKSADERYIYGFAAIALMILGVACINYVNLTTARSVRRAKEIGLRKTFGSGKKILAAQFLMESLLTVAAAGVIALLLVIVVLPFYNDLTLKDFTISDVFSPEILMVFAITLVVTTIVAGGYPALYMSRFEPAIVLRGHFKQKSHSGLFRKILTTVQFGISLVLIVSSMVVLKQLGLMQNSQLNEAGEQVISIRYGGFSGAATINKYQVFKNELLTNPDIASVTIANHLPRLDYFGPINMQYKLPEYGEDPVRWNRLNGDYDFPETFGMELIAGRFFQDGNTADSLSYVVNEAAAKELNLTPDELVGTTIWEPRNLNFVGEVDFNDSYRGTIIGVVKDFPYQSIYHEIEPLAVTPRPRSDDLIIHVKLNPGGFSEKIAYVENTWRKLYPDFGFDYWFIDSEFQRMYEQEHQIAGMTKNFTILAIILTCFGVYGLSSFMAQQKIKEIGIRKVLGANVGQIVVLLVSTFLKLIVIAALVAVPVTSFLISKYWLQGFSYQASVSFDIILLPMVFIFIITLLTMGFETIKAARANPVESLKYE